MGRVWEQSVRQIWRGSCKDSTVAVLVVKGLFYKKVCFGQLQANIRMTSQRIVNLKLLVLLWKMYDNKQNAMRTAIRPPGLTTLLELLGKDQFQIGALRHIMTSHA